MDTGIEKDTRALEDGLRGLGLGFRDVRLVVVTHAHLDHYGALAALRRLSNVPVAAQRIEAPYIERGEQSPTVPRTGVGRVFARICRGWKNEACAVDVVVEEETDLSSYGVDARIIRTPGHTPGSISIVTKEGEAVVGDLFRGKPGRRGLGWFCADEAASLESLDRILALNPCRIFLAHGPEADPVELRAYRASLGRVAKR